MTIGTTQVGMLLGGAKGAHNYSPKSYLTDNLNGSLGFSSLADVTSGLLNSAYQEQLPKSEKTSMLDVLKQYASESMEGPAADKLLADIAAVEDLMTFVTEDNYADHVASLISGNSEGLGNLTAGLLVSKLA